jgi:hypothetical protein
MMKPIYYCVLYICWCSFSYFPRSFTRYGNSNFYNKTRKNKTAAYSTTDIRKKRLLL